MVVRCGVNHTASGTPGMTTRHITEVTKDIHWTSLVLTHDGETVAFVTYAASVDSYHPGVFFDDTGDITVEGSLISNMCGFLQVTWMEPTTHQNGTYECRGMAIDVTTGLSVEYTVEADVIIGGNDVTLHAQVTSLQQQVHNLTQALHTCEAPSTDPCTTSPCLNGGTCTVLSTGAEALHNRRSTGAEALHNTGALSFHCTCMVGFTGSTCQHAPSTDPCTTSPCMNGGTCTVLSTGALSFHCTCAAEFTGSTCQHGEFECLATKDKMFADIESSNGTVCPANCPLSGPEMASLMREGMRVVRGRDWKDIWNTEHTADGPTPGTGTVTFVKEPNFKRNIDVNWDAPGYDWHYRMAGTMHPDSFDLKFDCMKTNIHAKISESSGARCPPNTYMTGAEMKQLMSVGDRVVRGRDWDTHQQPYGDQDGNPLEHGSHRPGTIVGISNAAGSKRNINVDWDYGGDYEDQSAISYQMGPISDPLIYDLKFACMG